jgi:multiple sugar transport system permease protein
MSDTAIAAAPARAPARATSPWDRLRTHRGLVGAWFMLPAAAFLLLFLAYPLFLGIWMSFTDARIGRPGAFIGLENYEWLLDDDAFIGATLFTIGYTVVASVFKFAIGLYLALLLNKHIPFRAIVRAVILIPFIVPTVLSAIAFWWLYDPQFSIISYLLVDKLGLMDGYIDFLGSAWSARFSLIAANIWRGIPFVAISLLAGLQTISPSLYEAALLDGSTAWQRFRFITFPMLLPILAIVMTFSIIFTFTDFQLVYAITRGGPVNSTHLLATLAFQRGIPGGQLGEGAAIAVSMIPFLVFATLFSYFALARRKWQQGEGND